MRIINFNAGPAGLPLPALERARDELLDYGGSGMSIMEHSHRGKEFEAGEGAGVFPLTQLLGVPGSPPGFPLPGGGPLPIAVVPMNFLPSGASADYVITGAWSEKAFSEAKMLGQPRVACTTVTADKRYVRIPRQSELQLDPKASYVHITSNNTIFGTQWMEYPN